MNIQTLDEILNIIENIYKEDDLHSRIKNAFRIYYLGMDQVFVAKRILKRTNFSNMSLRSSEIKHVENAGWILDQNYLNNVYFSALKTNLLFSIWYILKSYDGKNEYKDISKNLGKLITALGNNLELKESFSLLGVNKNQGDAIDFVTPEFILKVGQEFTK